METIRTEITAPPRPDAVDMDVSQRPGVPMLNKPNKDRAVSGSIPQQEPTVEILVSPEVGRLPPVFGTTLPPKGLSGAIRRAAYKIPDHKANHWTLLMLGDRVDIWES